MIIQSRRVWVVDTFMPCQIKTNGEKIEAILPYETLPVDEDYGDLRIVLASSISIPMAPMDGTPMTLRKKACATG